MFTWGSAPVGKDHGASSSKLVTYRHDPVEVMDIDVHKYSVETSEDLLALRLEGLRSRCTGGLT